VAADAAPASFAALIAALAAAGMRAGWLELRSVPPPAVDAALEEAAAAGVRRAVAVGGGRSVAVKPLAGAPVLRDVLREHFQGCAVVLVQGPVAAGEGGSGTAGTAGTAGLARLAACEGGWRIEAAGGTEHAATRHTDTAGLLASLRQPHPWFNV
jgi:hypothetical protein